MNPQFGRRIITIFTVVLIDVLGITIMLPLLPFYSEHFGTSAQIVGLLISTYALYQLIASPILGHLSDRFVRRPVLIVSQLGTFIGFLILANAQSLTWIFISRIIDGLTAGNLSTALWAECFYFPPQLIGFAASFIGYSSLCVIANPLLVAITGLISSLGGGVLRPVLISKEK